jgi:hypothetical protein
MTATIDGDGLAIETEERVDERHAEAAEEPIIGDERSEEHRSHAPLPWIGALANPRLGPMAVVNDGGYLVPLCTAGDLLRGCRFFWRRARD